MVFSGLVTAWRFATCPARRSPLLVNATTDGVVLPPSWFGITTGCPPSITATTEFVVPKSIPMILLMFSQTLPDECVFSLKPLSNLSALLSSSPGITGHQESERHGRLN